MSSRLVKIATLVTLPLVLILVIAVWTRPVDAREVHDFAPPLSESMSQASVAAANARSAVDRALIGRELGLTNPLVLPAVQTIYFEQTGHHLSNRSGFLDYWRANGQTVIFGYPVSEEIVENGRIVQYFERARFEYHPAQGAAPAQVRLGLIGHEILAYQGMPAGIPDPQNGARYFLKPNIPFGVNF